MIHEEKIEAIKSSNKTIYFQARKREREKERERGREGEKLSWDLRSGKGLYPRNGLPYSS